jgi:hypothetical protein
LENLAAAYRGGFIGKEVVFEFKGVRREFVAENYLMSYASPNFYLHPVTAYDLLRARGLAVGKKGFMSQLAIKA